MTITIPPKPRSCRLCQRRAECIAVQSVLLAYSLAPFAFENFLYDAYDRLGDRCRYFKSDTYPPRESIRQNSDIFFSNHQDNIREAFTLFLSL